MDYIPSIFKLNQIFSLFQIFNLWSTYLWRYNKLLYHLSWKEIVVSLKEKQANLSQENPKEIMTTYKRNVKMKRKDISTEQEKKNLILYKTFDVK